MMKGFIQLNRKILQWQWYKNNNVFRVFLHCLLEANHKNNMFEGVMIERGSLATSHDKIAAALGLSKQQVRTSINKLKSTHVLDTKPTPKYLLVSIVKYDDYQGSNAKYNTQITPNQHPDNTPLTPNNKDNNDNNTNIITIESAFKKIKQDTKWLNVVADNYILTEQELSDKISDFTKHALLQGYSTLSILDYKQHFINWYKKSTGKGFKGRKIIKYKKPTL